MQAAIIGLALGWHFRNTPAGTPAAWWPYALFGYALLAVLLPWSLRNYVEGEFRLPLSLLLGVVFALPMYVASRWLDDSPYRLIALACRGLAALWGVHFLIAIAAAGTVRRSSLRGPGERP